MIIYNNCVIAANSVVVNFKVNKSVVIGGIPAKVIKEIL